VPFRTDPRRELSAAQVERLASSPEHMGGESPAKGDKHVTFSSEPEASPGPKIRRQPTGLPTEYPDDDEPKADKRGVASSTESLEVSLAACEPAPSPSHRVHARRVPPDFTVEKRPNSARADADLHPNPSLQTSMSRYRNAGADAPASVDPTYVARLEQELAALKGSIAAKGDPHGALDTSTPVTASAARKAARGAAVLADELAGGRSQDDDLAVAKAVFSDDRLAKFEAALEQKFKDSGGYDSDLERELEAAGATPLEVRKLRAARADAAAKAETAYRAAEDAAVKATFDQQNEWMDEYREGGSSKPAAATGAVSGAVAGSKEINAARDAVDATRAVPPVVRAKAVSAPRTRRAVSARPSGSGGVDYLGAGAEHGDGLPRPGVIVRRKTATVPRPFSFEMRDRNKPKSISEQRLEQDLAFEAEMERAELAKQFRANDIPRHIFESRYQKMLEKEEMRREERRLSRRAALVETERPFSFHTRDEQKKKEEEAAAVERAKNRAKKFQKPFKAKDIPAAIKTPKLAALEDEARRRKEQARAAALAKLAEAKAPAAAEVKHGHGTSDSASKKKQWSFKPAPMKPVPDFDALHDKFFRKLQSARASKPTTVPEEFKLHEKDAKAKAAELKKIKNEMRQDEDALAEVRWPFASLRAKVNSKPPPAFNPPSDDYLRKNETLATKLRRQAVVKARKEGHFSTKAEKEALEAAQRDRENRRRAAAWAKTQTSFAGKKALDFGRSSMRGGDQHTKARHAQQAMLAKETVEKVLLENNVYTYVEEGSVV